jgi:hypothetical protein
MNRTKLNFLIDLVAFIGFVFLTTTGVLMRYMLPPGSGHYSTIWGLDRHEWGGIHFWLSIIFFSILAFHLVLHWRWIVSVFSGKQHQDSGFRFGLGIVGFLVIIAFSISPLLSPVEKINNQSQKSSISAHIDEEVSIRGSMTFAEIEKMTGVPAEYIFQSLKIPDTLSVDERVGPLKRQYGFEMNDVREAVRKYK